MKPELYASGRAVGLLKGFSPVPHQLEVDVVVPHQERGLPGFGEFLLVALNAHEALVARVSRYHAAGQLATDRGDAVGTRAADAPDAALQLEDAVVGAPATGFCGWIQIFCGRASIRHARQQGTHSLRCGPLVPVQRGP